LVVAVNANSPVVLGIPSSMFFHHLSLVEYGDITAELLTDDIALQWEVALAAANLSAGTFYMVTDGGKGRNAGMQRRFVPFR
jgi:hypothetical protein